MATRKAEGVWPAHVLPFAVGDLLPNTDWSDPLRGVLKMVHATARAHVMADKSADPLAEVQRVMWMVFELGLPSGYKVCEALCVREIGKGQWRGHAVGPAF